MNDYALDLGTTNSVLALQDSGSGSVRLIEIPGISRGQGDDHPVQSGHAIPSALHLGPLKRRWLWKRQEFRIGQAALDRETWSVHQPVIRNFKPALMTNAGEILARQGSRTWTARDCAWRFMKKLCGKIRQAEGEWPRSLTVGVPVDAYEPYRAQLRHIALSLGIRQFRLVDEPVAAAIGYGINLDQVQDVLVFDFGGGTMDLAVVRLDPKLTEAGRCKVLAKAGMPLGGTTVDHWLLDHFCQATGFDFDAPLPGDGKVWKNLVLDEARRVKETLYSRESEAFYLVPPEEYRNFDWRLAASAEALTGAVVLDRGAFRGILEQRGLYAAINEGIARVLRAAASNGCTIDDLGQVLLVGGSSLLPGVFKLFEQRFGRSRVQAWQPFNAVAYGAAIHAAGMWQTNDFITHDYALLTHDPRTFTPEYQVVIPRNTPFPTAPGFWRRSLVPTCSTGLPEKVFKLLICELGRKHHNYQEFWFDKDGEVQEMSGDSGLCVTPLNAEDPAMGVLNPPHEADNKTPRLEVSFMVNQDKWLCATVLDLLTRRTLMETQPVLRLR